MIFSFSLITEISRGFNFHILLSSHNFFYIYIYSFHKNDVNVDVLVFISTKF